MKLGLFTNCLSDKSWEETCSITRKSGFSGIDSIFSSIISISQSCGVSAAKVASPSGGLMALILFGMILSTTHLKLQKLSGNLGLINNNFMFTPFLKDFVHSILILDYFILIINRVYVCNNYTAPHFKNEV